MPPIQLHIRQTELFGLIEPKDAYGYNRLMRMANIAELKNRLSFYVRQVRRGETILVLDRRTPVARLVPVADPSGMGDDEGEAWLSQMQKRGVIHIGRRRGVDELLKPPPGRRAGGGVERLIEERQRR